MRALILTSFFFLALAVTGQELITDVNKQQLDAYIDHLVEHNQLIGTVSLFEQGTEMYSRTFGTEQIPASSSQPPYVYQIGSITKMVTAVMLMQLHERGEIDLSEPLSTYFPDMPNAGKIQLWNMLNHTSGLGDYVTKEDSLFYWLRDPVSQGEILAEIKRQGSLFMPGDSVRYSNSAYYLLARILERVYGQPYAQILEKQITEPLGLRHTQAVAKGKAIEHIAPSLERSGNTWAEIREFHFLNASGVGDITSTARDMNVFMHALFSGKLITEANLENMLPEKRKTFGYGFMKVPFYKHIAYGHGGDTFGTHSVTSYNPENGLAVSYMVNGELYPTNHFAVDMLNLVYERKFEYPEFYNYTADPAWFDAYSGYYGSDAFPLNIKIFVENDALMGQGDGQPSFTLSPVSEHVFEFLPARLTIEFKPGKKLMILEQNGQKFELLPVEK